MSTYLFTSESVSVGHPDKVADQISDAILDACLTIDPYARVACETLVTRGLVVLAGEVSMQGNIDYHRVVRKTISEIGYNHVEEGFDADSCGITVTVHEQSPDIALGVSSDKNSYQQLGAGDQGLMFGYACNETPELMPMPIMLAHALVRQLRLERIAGTISYLRPDAKVQVTLEYDSTHHPIRVNTIVLSTQHEDKITLPRIQEDMRELVHHIIPAHLLDEKTIFFFNPTGRFVLGGPSCDTGLTGRKIIVDTYGGMARHGGGAFSGKDPTKVDRSAAYMARYIAKNIVAAKLAKRCEIQLSYAIGIPHPISISVDTFGTSSVDEKTLMQIIPCVFPLTPSSIIECLELNHPIYRHTAYEGHFGRLEPEFSWEKIDRIPLLLETLKKN